MNKNDDFSLFIKRFGRFLRKEGNQRRPNFNPKKNFKKGEESSPIPRCYGCNQLGHMKMECPTYKKKMKKLEKKSLKEKKAYITWEENDMDSLSDSENVVANPSLMARDCESDENVTFSNIYSSISFDELQDAFNDLHKESIKLAKLVSSNKKVILNFQKNKFQN